MSITGSTLAFASQQPKTASTIVAGTTVRVGGHAARLLYASPNEVIAVIPSGVSNGIAELVVTNAEGFESKGMISITLAAPGVFTSTGDGRGEAIIIDADKLLPAPFDPTGDQLRLAVFATGCRNAFTLSATLDGQPVKVEGVFPSPSLPGLDEIHLFIPAHLRGAGKVTLVIDTDGSESNPTTLVLAGSPIRDIMINEFLADPPDGSAGDANHDGVRDASADEFIELVNATTRDLDISGFQLETRTGTGNDIVRHRFVANTILPAGTSIVVFGGGKPSPEDSIFKGSQVVKASSGGLSLNNTAGTITLRDKTTSIVAFVTYGASVGLPANLNQSLTRDPDVTGAFLLHTKAAGVETSLFSPGIRSNLNPFLPFPAVFRISVTPESIQMIEGTVAQLTARAFDSDNRELNDVIFHWQTNGSKAVEVDQTGHVKALAPGFGQVFALARGMQSNGVPTLVSAAPTPTPTATPTPTPKPTPTPTPTPSPSPSPTPKPSPSPTPTATLTPTPSPSSTPTPTATPTPTPTSSPSSTPTPTATPTPTPSPSPTPTPTPGPSPTPSPSPSPTPTVQPKIVISQIFGGGGNSGAPFRNDFIELFNGGPIAVSAAGWSVQYASATASTWSVTPLPNLLLGPGQYLLIQEGSGGTNGSGLPTPDVNGIINLAATAGKVALVNGTTALSGSCPNSSSIIDFVGYGSTANCFRVAPAPAPANATSVARKTDGCTDTQTNSTDFAVAAPKPRNSSSPANPCLSAIATLFPLAETWPEPFVRLFATPKRLTPITSITCRQQLIVDRRSFLEVVSFHPT